MLNIYKTRLKLVANIVRTSQLNKVKTCLIKICWQGGFKYPFSKWLQNVIEKLDGPKPSLINQV